MRGGYWSLWLGWQVDPRVGVSADRQGARAWRRGVVPMEGAEADTKEGAAVARDLLALG